MRITERRLRSIIRSVIVEMNDPLADPDYPERGERVSVRVGDKVRVLHVDPPYSGDRMDWGGCDGIIASVGGDICTITDPTMELGPLIDMPMYSGYIAKI